MKDNNSDNLKLKEKLFESIEHDGICPRSKLFFRCREGIVWFLWLLSVAVGSVAVAVSLFVMTHHQYALYEATHSNWFTFIVDVMPYLWIIIFGLMVYVAVYNLRHTAKGYRYPVWVILGSSLVFSFAGGSALQMFGLGYEIDHILGSNMTMYLSQDKMELRMWQDPDDGRLLGRQTYSTLVPTSTVIFEDSEGKSWQMNVVELQPREINLLASGHKVKVLGKCIGDDVKVFHACGVFPVMMDKKVSVRDLNAEREGFVERIGGYAERKRAHNAEILESLEDAIFSEKETDADSVCMDLMPVQKMMPE